ncbi:hypothetical protein ABE10_10970 [Bacillus toyonensis]|nr:hypothetical protein [Bacillus toyonensis]
MKWLRRFLVGLPLSLIILLIPAFSSLPFTYWNVIGAVLAMVFWLVSQEVYERRARKSADGPHRP